MGILYPQTDLSPLYHSYDDIRDQLISWNDEFGGSNNPFYNFVVFQLDTIGVSSHKNIIPLFKTLIMEYPSIEFGAHFHTNSDEWEEKIDAAYKSGCKRFDTTIKGYGGCPMSQDELVGNMPTERVLSFFESKEIDLNLDNIVLNTVVNNISVYF